MSAGSSTIDAAEFDEREWAEAALPSPQRPQIETLDYGNRMHPILGPMRNRRIPSSLQPEERAAIQPGGRLTAGRRLLSRRLLSRRPGRRFFGNEPLARQPPVGFADDRVYRFGVQDWIHIIKEWRRLGILNSRGILAVPFSDDEDEDEDNTCQCVCHRCFRCGQHLNPDDQG